MPSATFFICYAECRCAECCYAECHYDEYRGAKNCGKNASMYKHSSLFYRINKNRFVSLAVGGFVTEARQAPQTLI